MTNHEIAYLVLEIVQKAYKAHQSSENDLRSSDQLDRNGSVTIEFVSAYMRELKEEREYTEEHIQLISNIFSLMAE